jgi:chromosome segregation ATPase
MIPLEGNMDINIILGILLILLIIYFVVLVVFLRMRNQQVEKAREWNKFRDGLVVQAQEDQVKAHRISLSIKEKYSDLGIPYDEDRDRAIAILGKISDNARATLHDRNHRSPISDNPEPFSWNTFLIAPLWREYQQRQGWWQTTQKIESKLSRNPSGFSSVEKLCGRLAEKGKIVRAEFESIIKALATLKQAFQDEARTTTQFRDQMEELIQLDQKIDKTIDIYLMGKELSPKQVATAASTLGSYQRAYERLNQTLITSKEIRQDSRSQLVKNQVLIDTIDALLKIEEEANRPVQTFRDALNEEIELIREQEQKRVIGIYLKQDAQDQPERLRTLEKNLRVLTHERVKLEERLRRGEKEIRLTEEWMQTIQPPFTIDQTNIVLEEVQKQQLMLDRIIQTSEDLDLLSSQIFIDPQKLASNRTEFDQRVKNYLELLQGLGNLIPPAIERIRTAIKKLRPLNKHYHNSLNLDALTTEIQTLEESWAATQDLYQIRESQIKSLTTNLHQFEKSLQQINQFCQKAESQYQICVSDRADLQRIIEDQTFVEYHQVMQVISREDQLPFSDQAGEYADQAEELNTALEQIDTDFDSATREAARLLANMKTTWGSYKTLYSDEMKAYQALVKKMKTLKSRFEGYQDHNLSVIRTRVAEPVVEITGWLQLIPSQSIQDLREHTDLGYDWYEKMGELIKDLAEEDQRYSHAKDEAQSAINGAKSAILDAETALNKIPWRVKSGSNRSQAAAQRNPVLEHSYRYLDSAETAYREITDPDIEYSNSVDKAVSDLKERVCLNADHAKATAKDIHREIGEQIDDIKQKCRDLEKTLADGQGFSMRLDDTGFTSQWAQIYRKYSRFESELQRQSSYREAFSYLEQALIESRYQIERMREFERSG